MSKEVTKSQSTKHIQELFKKKYLSETYPRFVPELYKEKRFYQYAPNIYRENIKFIEIIIYKLLNYFFVNKKVDYLVVGRYIRTRGIRIWVYKYPSEKNSTKISSRQYLGQDRGILSSSSINGGTKMPIIDKTNNFPENLEDSEKYEDIVQKLIEVLIYLKQEVILYEN